MNKAMIVGFVSSLAFASASSSAAEVVILTKAKSEAVLTSDIRYGVGATEEGDKPLMLDLYAPRGKCAAPRPTVIFVHGGGFVEGSKTRKPVTLLADSVTSRGMNFISIQYRLRDDRPVVSDEFRPFFEAFEKDNSSRFADRGPAFTAAVEDAVRAMRWTNDEGKKHCIDADRLGLWGASAGAMTVLHAAYAMDQFGIERPEPRVVVNYWGMTFLPNIIEASEAPLFILHGDDDEVVAYDGALAIEDEATVAGLPHSFYTVLGGKHGFGGVAFAQTKIGGQSQVDLTADFIAAHLLGGDPLYETRNVDHRP